MDALVEAVECSVKDMLVYISTVFAVAQTVVLLLFGLLLFSSFVSFFFFF